MNIIKIFGFLVIKFLIITVFIIVSVFFILIILDKTIFKPTPKSVLKSTFSISLKDFDYSVDFFEKQNCPNGDGHTLVVYKFNKLTQENIDYLMGFGLKPLPILEDNRHLMLLDEIPYEYFKINSGYYIYELLHPIDFRDFKIFIFDIEKKKAVLYYQYM